MTATTIRSFPSTLLTFRDRVIGNRYVVCSVFPFSRLIQPLFQVLTRLWFQFEHSVAQRRSRVKCYYQRVWFLVVRPVVCLSFPFPVFKMIKTIFLQVLTTYLIPNQTCRPRSHLFFKTISSLDTTAFVIKTNIRLTVVFGRQPIRPSPFFNQSSHRYNSFYMVTETIVYLTTPRSSSSDLVFSTPRFNF